jgi:hypothetical protein
VWILGRHVGKLLVWILSRFVRKWLMWISVADPGCLSWIPDPDFYPSRVPDPFSWILDPPEPGSQILDPISPGSWNPDLRSRILYLRSRFPDHRSWISDPRFRIPDLGFQVQEEQQKRSAKNFFPTFFVVTILQN